MKQYPEFSRFEELAAGAGLVPVCREIVADLDTPLTIFAKVAAGEAHAFLLESLEGGEEWGRYSFIGIRPLLTFASEGAAVTIRRRDKVEEHRGDPVEILKETLASFHAIAPDYMPRFFGGAVGYMGYDMVRFMERLPERKPPMREFPDSSLMVPRIVLVHDNLKQTVQIVNCVEVLAGADLQALYTEAFRQIEAVVALIRGPLPAGVTGARGTAAELRFQTNMAARDFHAMVEKAKEYIRAGDIIQVVLSQRFHTTTDLDPFLLYRALRHINPSPYLFYLKLEEIVLIGSSPEILVRLEGEQIELRPIAGTRPRGVSDEEDRRLEEELLADPKERAEHLMLVDLGRNDVGRVAAAGQVEVDDLLVIERYSHVMHIVSGVRGRIGAGRDMFDVLRACFPAGTVSGAPKIRAMEIIEELEPERRGPYAGAVGYFGFTGNMDLCIAIRTIFMKGRDMWLQAGAGIVADSVAENEYQETINKAMGMRRAVEMAQKGF
ncbi:MAG: anthranilate synthase component I [Thermodesulfobacteriota bacterium]